jgi:hypothetical protein
MSRARARKAANRTRQAARPTCEHCCFHLMDGYLHGKDVPPGHVKEECCRCHTTRVIPREQCAEIQRREPKPIERSHGWQLTEADRCRRTRVTFDAQQGGRA